ncbi:SAM-dependent methyltransferase [Peterkaempfera griseoplana]|uniref:SAM-dependent methyltransferase n=1 Tax=Peterkaempfera griseoplana TaxID=66896 RepID=UPI0006E1E51B|nr:SAM-dependent methyltransferase [Peterkaempfera griseoplana]
MTEQRAVPTGVGRTALGVAAARARESLRSDRLFEDPLAAAFLAAAGWPGPEQRPAAPTGDPALGESMFHHLVIRTRFFDDRLLAAAADGCLQVVLTAAGLDTRAFRLPWPDGTALYEIDFPGMLDFKERVLAEQQARPLCRRTVLPADLREDWGGRLVAAGFDPGARTVWLAEGLLIYLSPSETAGLLTEVGALSAPGSRLFFTHPVPDSTVVREVRTTPSMSGLATLWQGGLDEDPSDWLARHGWQSERQDRAALAASYGRPGGSGSRGGFHSAVRLPG